MLTTALIVLHWALVIGVAVKVVFRRLPVGTSLAWVIIVSLLPVVGFAIYILIGDHRMGRKRLRHGDIVRSHYQSELAIREGAITRHHPDVEGIFYQIATVAAKDTGFLVRPDNRVDILTEPEAMFASMIADIEAAQSICHLEFYIVHAEGRVLDVFEALMAASQRGVVCKLLADHIGSQPFFRSAWPEKLRHAGVEVIDSLPTGVIKTFFTRSDLRNHRKIIVIDRWIGYCGSFNLADPDYFKRDSDVGKWIDLFLRIEGDASEGLSVVFNTDYVLESQTEASVDSIPKLASIQDLPPETEAHCKLVQIIPSGPEMRTSVIFETLVSSIYAARESIRITTPYLVPDESLLMALTNAARRGVHVQLIVPQRVDSFLARHASRSYYGELMEAGVGIHEYRGGLLHTKVVLVDNEVCYLGTVNLDMRSFYLNLEITIALHSPEDCRSVSDVLNRYMAQSVTIAADEYLDRNRSKPEIFLENLVRLAGPLL